MSTPSKKQNYSSKSRQVAPLLDALNVKIIKEIVSDPDVRSAVIASKHKHPLSTIQRRRTRLEQTVLKKQYHIDINRLGWREADLFISVERGDCEEVAKKLLEEYNNVITASLRIGDPGVNVMAKVFYRKSEHLHDLIESMRTIPSVSAVKWSEIVKVVGTNDASMIDAMFTSPAKD
jgi:DNA-binding Lrp family transcriptional regulator